MLGTLVWAGHASAQAPRKQLKRPKLVVGIVVDQMRYDYLWRYWNLYGKGGFKRLVRHGKSFDQAHYSYFPTYTGPGHACVYTGATPAINGIVGNDWFDRETGAPTYVTADGNVEGVGTTGKTGQQSPRHLLSNTITDELELASQRRSKVVGIALKDRGAILPAGHLADAAYWYDGQSGHFVSSTFYMKALPGWVEAFNGKGFAQTYQHRVWAPLLPMENYTASTADDVPWEGSLLKGASPTLPVDLAKYDKADFELLRSTPFGNQLTTDFALAALHGEHLGTGPETDFLCVSYSSTDYVGHRFGPESVEIEDTYLRLDHELARLMQAVHKQCGRDVLFFLTADHGAALAPGHMIEEDVPAGLADEKALKHVLGEGVQVEAFMNQQFYLKAEIGASGVDPTLLARLRSQKGIRDAFTANTLQQTGADPMRLPYLRGYHPQRSGDIFVTLEPGWVDGGYATGTTHGQPYDYDTHVPLLFYGWHVRRGSVATPVDVCDIAPTVAHLLHLSAPSGCMGKILW